MFNDKEYAIIFKSATAFYQKIYKIRRRFQCITLKFLYTDPTHDIIQSSLSLIHDKYKMY